MSSNPCVNKYVSPLDELAEILQCRWENIDRARARTQNTLQKLSKIIDSVPAPDWDANVVVHGSLARQECTSGSDLDWTLLVDGQSDTRHQEIFLNIKKSFGAKDLAGNRKIFTELGLKSPGQEGTFGTLVFSQPIIHHIGGEEDSNSNTTRRILILLEGLPIGERPDAFNRVRKTILRRYLVEDGGLLKADLDGKRRWVPLFLLNDFARYWRTMAVDFAYKQFDRGNQGYALRSIKLGMSRKLLFASGLLACFWCDPIVSRIKGQEPSIQGVIDCLDVFLSRTPLERVASYYVAQILTGNSDFLKQNAKELFDAYDAFLGILNDEQQRDCLDKLELNEQDNSKCFHDARKIRQSFRLAIQDMFMHEDSPLLQHSIEKGVF